MEIILLCLTTILIVSSIAVLGFLNKKYDLGLNDMSGCTWFDEPNSDELNKKIAEKEKQINDLKQRVQILEKLVTDPREQLKRDIDNL